jgi:hypothetical protein
MFFFLFFFFLRGLKRGEDNYNQKSQFDNNYTSSLSLFENHPLKRGKNSYTAVIWRKRKQKLRSKDSKYTTEIEEE